MSSKRIVTDYNELFEIVPELASEKKYEEFPFVFFVDEKPTITGEIEITGDYAYVRMMRSLEKGKGYGKEFIEYLKKLPNCLEIWGEATLEAIPFWSKMGAEFNDTVYKQYENHLNNGTPLEEDYLLPFTINCINKEELSQ